MPDGRLRGSFPVGRRVRMRIPVPRFARAAKRDAPGEGRSGTGTAPVQHAAATVGAIFGLLGLLGFLPGITVNLHALEGAGPHSGALLFGVFSVSVLRNVAYLAFAVAGVALAATPATARWFLLGGGTVVALLALYGVLVEQDSAANVVPVHRADNWLHLVFGAGMIALGALPGRQRG